VERSFTKLWVRLDETLGSFKFHPFAKNAKDGAPTVGGQSDFPPPRNSDKVWRYVWKGISIMWLKRQYGTRETSLKQLGSLESELMERIWERGEFSVRDLHMEFASRLAYTTVMTTLDRLYKKKLLQRRKVGKAFYYAAAVTEKEYQERLTQHLFGMVLTEATNNNAVLSCFVDAVGETDKDMLDQLDQLVRAKRRALRRAE
jgi:predicted transcriptional regulator